MRKNLYPIFLNIKNVMLIDKSSPLILRIR